MVGGTDGYRFGGEVEWEGVKSSITITWQAYEISKSRCQVNGCIDYSRTKWSVLNRVFQVTSRKCKWIHENYSGLEHMKRIKYISECFIVHLLNEEEILTWLPVLMNKCLSQSHACCTPAPFYANYPIWLPHSVCCLSFQIFYPFDFNVLISHHNETLLNKKL